MMGDAAKPGSQDYSGGEQLDYSHQQQLDQPTRLVRQ